MYFPEVSVSSTMGDSDAKNEQSFLEYLEVQRCLHSVNVPSLWYYTTHVANCLSY